ncbi:MAG TPA: mechanosensitive ion channel family protein [Candidatus Nitrosotalea sp.]|nr:mechanosensitive ion channel family protein [Candidatus Nitrosotalea sp.]
MDSSKDKSPQDLLRAEQAQRPNRKTFQKEIYTLSLKIIATIVGTWAGLHLFELFAAPLLGITHLHIEIAGIVATVIIAFLIIAATRRLLRRFAGKVHPQFSASLSFFTIILISLVASLSVLHQLDVNPQEILISGGVAAIIVGIGVSTIVGNILSSGLILTTYPAKIGDTIQVVNDNIHGKIQEINLMYTTIQTDEGKEYVVPNNAIIQGNIRILKDVTAEEQLPYSEGDRVEFSSPHDRYAGTVIKVTPKFTTILDDGRTKEYVVANRSVLDGNYSIVRHRPNS